MKNDEKIKNSFLEKVSERLRKAPEGLRRARESLSTVFHAWNPTLEISKKFTEECFAQYVDGAPSTAPSELFRVEKWTGRRKTRSRPFNDLSLCEALFS